MDEDVESQRYYSPQLLRRLESKNRELEARISDMYVEFKTMKSLNQDLKSQVQNLQQQYDRLVSQNIEPESGVNKFKHQSHRTETMTQYVPRQLYNLQQHSREMQPADPVVERLAKDFDERCYLMELNQTTSQIEFDSLTHIKPIRAYLAYGTTNRSAKPVEILRCIATSPNLLDYLFLNRGYRRIELVNTNSWKALRGWSKQDLDYGERDEIR
ncbi:unnamed protein product, partial [Rotaria sp. Silwood2]